MTIHGFSAVCLSFFLFFAFSAVVGRGQTQQARVPFHWSWLLLSDHESRGPLIWGCSYQAPCDPAGCLGTAALPKSAVACLLLASNCYPAEGLQQTTLCQPLQPNANPPSSLEPQVSCELFSGVLLALLAGQQLSPGCRAPLLTSP